MPLKAMCPNRKYLYLWNRERVSKFQRQTYGFWSWWVQRKSVWAAILLFPVVDRCRSFRKFVSELVNRCGNHAGTLFWTRHGRKARFAVGILMLSMITLSEI